MIKERDGLTGCLDFFRCGSIGQVEGHEGLEGRARWQCSKDAIPVRQGESCGGDRWTQVGHDDSTTEQGRTARWQGGDRRQGSDRWRQHSHLFSNLSSEISDLSMIGGWIVMLICA